MRYLLATPVFLFCFSAFAQKPHDLCLSIEGVRLGEKLSKSAQKKCAGNEDTCLVKEVGGFKYYATNDSFSWIYATSIVGTRTRLPFGISANDKFTDILKKIASSKRLVSLRQMQNGHLAVSIPACPNSEYEELYVVFNEADEIHEFGLKATVF